MVLDNQAEIFYGGVMNIPKIEEIYLHGKNSQKEIRIEVLVVKELVDAYLTLIPNEKRTMKMSLMVMRFHDDVKNMLISEATAVANEVHKRTLSVYKAEEGDSDDLSVR
jgi:hypothetical protein